MTSDAIVDVYQQLYRVESAVKLIARTLAESKLEPYVEEAPAVLFIISGELGRLADRLEEVKPAA